MVPSVVTVISNNDQSCGPSEELLELLEDEELLDELDDELLEEEELELELLDEELDEELLEDDDELEEEELELLLELLELELLTSGHAGITTISAIGAVIFSIVQNKLFITSPQL